MKFIIGTEDQTKFIVFKFGKYEEGREHLPDPPILSRVSFERAMVFYDQDLRKVLKRFRKKYPRENLVAYKIVEDIIKIEEVIDAA